MGSRAGGTTKRSDRTQLKSSTAARKVSAPVADPVQAEAVGESQRSGRSRRRRGGAKAPESVNEPIPFLEFVGNHPVGSEVQGLVDRFSSHGAYVVIDGAQCYVPLKAMGDPPPTSAREVLEVGEVRSFVVQSFDSSRRGIDLCSLRRRPCSSDEHPPPDHDTQQDKPAQEAPSMALGRKRQQRSRLPRRAARKTTARKAPARKTAAKKTAKRSTARKAPARRRRRRRRPRRSTAKKATAKKAPARKKAAAKRSTKKAPAKKRTTARKAPARKKAAAKKR